MGARALVCEIRSGRIISFEFMALLGKIDRMNEAIENQLSSLSPAEQLEIAEYIYDSLARQGMLIQDWQIDETRKRAEQLEKNPDSALSHSEMWDEVDRRRNARKN